MTESTPGTADKTLLKEIIASHNHEGHSATRWFVWMLDDCLASFGKRLLEPWTEKQNEHLFALGGQYSRAVFENPFQDVLGIIYQELATSYGKKGMGQYFTPDSIAMMMAKIQYDSKIFEKKGAVTVYEPTAGSGVMLLGFMRNIMMQNPEFLRKLSLTAIDLDLICVKMTVLQVLANNLIHKGNLGEVKVFHGNSLGNPEDLSLFFHASTPEFDKLALEGRQEVRDKVVEVVDEKKERVAKPLVPKKKVEKGQTSIFDFL